MKNTIKWFGIIAFVVIIGFSLASCDIPCSHTDLNPPTYTKLSTCMEKGFTESSCKQCGEIVRKELPLSDHSHRFSDTTVDEIHKPGNGRYVCTRTGCDHVYKVGDKGPAGGTIIYAAPDAESPFTVEGFEVDGYGGLRSLFFKSYTAYYLEAAPVTLSSPVAWASANFQTTPIEILEYQNVIMTATETLGTTNIGTGRKNTAMIIFVDRTGAPPTHNNNAAKAAKDYTTGANDWFLPSYIELARMFDSEAGLRTSLGTRDYWTSTQKDNIYAYKGRFIPNALPPGVGFVEIGKQEENYVRPVRAF